MSSAPLVFLLVLVTCTAVPLVQREESTVENVVPPDFRNVEEDVKVDHYTFTVECLTRPIFMAVTKHKRLICMQYENNVTHDWFLHYPIDEYHKDDFARVYSACSNPGDEKILGRFEAFALDLGKLHVASEDCRTLDIPEAQNGDLSCPGDGTDAEGNRYNVENLRGPIRDNIRGNVKVCSFNVENSPVDEALSQHRRRNLNIDNIP